MSKLAAHGGTPVRHRPFPSTGDASGRHLADAAERLAEVARSGRLNRVGGTEVDAFEAEFARLHGDDAAVASTSGTAALHIAVGCVNPEPGDEIVVAPITDIGSVYGIVAQNAIPVFADVDPRTYCTTAETIAPCLTERTRAVIVVHLFGQMAELDPILELCAPRGIAVIEDCCQALLAEDRARLAGAVGDFGCFSFQGSKHISTGDGGMTLVRDPATVRRARLFSDKGWPRDGSGRDHEFIAPNYRMTELQGALGRAQLPGIADRVARRRAIADALSARLQDLRSVEPPFVRPGARSSWWLYVFTLDAERLAVPPDEFARLASAEGVPISCGYIGKPLFMYRALQERAAYGTAAYPWEGAGTSRRYPASECPNAWNALRRMLVLPMCEAYTDGDVRDIGDAISKVAEALAV